MPDSVPIIVGQRKVAACLLHIWADITLPEHGQATMECNAHCCMLCPSAPNLLYSWCTALPGSLYRWPGVTIFTAVTIAAATILRSAGLVILFGK